MNMPIMQQVAWLAYRVLGRPDLVRRKVLPLQLAALEYARDMIGVAETSENWGPQIQEFLAAAGVHVPAAWCAAFVNWCAQKAGGLLGELSPLEGVPHQAYVQSYYQHGKAKGWEIHADEVRPGDLFLIWSSSLKRWAHIGFVEKVELGLGRFSTIEGNTNVKGSREGLYVMQRQRQVSPSITFMRWA